VTCEENAHRSPDSIVDHAAVRTDLSQ
jgi:hypothetical protein